MHVVLGRSPADLPVVADINNCINVTSSCVLLDMAWYYCCPHLQFSCVASRCPVMSAMPCELRSLLANSLLVKCMHMVAFHPICHHPTRSRPTSCKITPTQTDTAAVASTFA
jgi:hypothetical protein